MGHYSLGNASELNISKIYTDLKVAGIGKESDRNHFFSPTS